MRIAPCGETGAPFPALDPLDTEATVKPAISEHASRWLRSHRIRRGAERGPAALALLLSGALAARFAPSPRLALLLLTLSALGALGLFAWGLRRTWSSPAALLRRADGPWGDDLLQTGQAIEAGSAQGSTALQAAVLARARAQAPDRSSGAVAPLRAPWAALGLCLALLSLHGMAGRRYGPAAAPALARSLEGGRMDGARPGQAALPARSPHRPTRWPRSRPSPPPESAALAAGAPERRAPMTPATPGRATAAPPRPQTRRPKPAGTPGGGDGPVVARQRGRRGSKWHPGLGPTRRHGRQRGPPGRRQPGRSHRRQGPGRRRGALPTAPTPALPGATSTPCNRARARPKKAPKTPSPTRAPPREKAVKRPMTSRAKGTRPPSPPRPARARTRTWAKARAARDGPAPEGPTTPAAARRSPP